MIDVWTGTNETGLTDAQINKTFEDPGSMILFIDYPPWLLYFAAICCCIFMLVGILGNFITVVGLSRSKKLRNSTAVFIMNLSMSDLMFCCFNLPLAASTFWHRTWLHGPLLCRLFPLLRYGLVAVSIFTVLAIAINRYVMIGHPRIYPKLYRSRYLIVMVLATWIFAFGPLMLTWFGKWGRFGLDPTIGSCSILPDPSGRNPKEFLFVLAFVAPCTAIVICYARIFYIVRKASRSSGRDQVVTREATETSFERSGCTRSEEKDEEFSATSSSFIKTNPCSVHPWKEKCTCKEITMTEKTGVKAVDPGTDKSIFANVIADIPFADDYDGGEVDVFFENCREKRREGSDTASTMARKRLEKMATATVLEPIFWVQRLAGAEIERLEPPRTPTRSRSITPEQGLRTRVFRRESKFRSFGRNRNDVAGRMSAKDRKLLKMILVIFLSFLACYLPITVTKLFKDSIDWRGFNIAGYILIYLTTCINPVIYVVMSAEYRGAYKNVLLCRSETATAKQHA